MSYDIDLISTSGVVEESFNITYNVSGMFYTVFPEKGIRQIYGQTGIESISDLLTLYSQLIDDKDTMLTFEPANGWGSWIDTVEVVNKMCIAATMYPSAVWKGD